MQILKLVRKLSEISLSSKEFLAPTLTEQPGSVVPYNFMSPDTPRLLLNLIHYLNYQSER